MHNYKRKGDKTSCDNHRGISLLCIPGKILAADILNRLTTHIADSIVPESQCRFIAQAGAPATWFLLSVRYRRNTVKRIRSSTWCFVDLTKDFDTVNRNGLWKILQKSGCPDKLTALISCFHDGMQARVQENGDASDPFQVSNGVKQGCVLALTLFSILSSAIATEECTSSFALMGNSSTCKDSKPRPKCWRSPYGSSSSQTTVHLVHTLTKTCSASRIASQLPVDDLD